MWCDRWVRETRSFCSKVFFEKIVSVKWIYDDFVNFRWMKKNNIFWDSIFKRWIWQLMIVLLFERAGNFNVQKPFLKREVHKLCPTRPLPWKIWWHESLIFWDLFFVNYVNTLMYVVLKNELRSLFEVNMH